MLQQDSFSNSAISCSDLEKTTDASILNSYERDKHDQLIPDVSHILRGKNKISLNVSHRKKKHV